MYINFCSQNVYIYFLSYMDTCIVIIIYCQRHFLLLLVNNIVYINFFGGPIYLQQISVFMQDLKFGSVADLAVQLFNKIKRKKMMEEDEELEKTCFSVFPHVSHVMSKYTGKFVIFWYVLDIYVSRNENNLKLKVKSEFSF